MAKKEAAGSAQQQVEGDFFGKGSRLFRAVNFELYAKGNRTIALAGSLLLLLSVGTIASIDPKTRGNTGVTKERRAT